MCRVELKKTFKGFPEFLFLNSRGECVASVLQCVAVCCNVLQCAAVCSSVLQCVAECCRVLQCVAVCGSVFQCVPHEMGLMDFVP